MIFAFYLEIDAAVIQECGPTFLFLLAVLLSDKKKVSRLLQQIAHYYLG